MVAVARTLCALLEGRFEEAEELIEEAFQLGERTIPWNAAVTRHLQLFALRREQRRLDELEATVRHAMHTHRTYPIWRCVLADLYAELGREEEARAEFERFATSDFTELPFNEEWLLGMTLLADVCAALGDAPARSRSTNCYCRTASCMPSASLRSRSALSPGLWAGWLPRPVASTKPHDTSRRQFGSTNKAAPAPGPPTRATTTPAC
jgi:tetratricopeptide (TPR) repeat protein